MRRILVCLSLAGCTRWATVPPTSVHGDRAFVIATDTAYDVTDASYDGTHLVGQVKRAWFATACRTDARDPGDIIEDCHWAQNPAYDGKPIALDPTTIHDVHAQRIAKAKTAAVAVGVAIGVVAVFVAVVAIGLSQWEPGE